MSHIITYTLKESLNKAEVLLGWEQEARSRNNIWGVVKGRVDRRLSVLYQQLEARE